MNIDRMSNVPRSHVFARAVRGVPHHLSELPSTGQHFPPVA